MTALQDFFAPHAALGARLAIWNKRFEGALTRLAGCTLQKITATDDGLLVMGVYRPGDDRSSVVLSIRRGEAGPAITATRPPAQNKPNSLVQMARKHLQGRSLQYVYASLDPVAIVLEFYPPRLNPDAEPDEADEKKGRRKQKEEDDYADALILDMEARPARLVVARRHEGVPERYAGVAGLAEAFGPHDKFFESLCEWTLENTKTKRRATFERPLLPYCAVPQEREKVVKVEKAVAPAVTPDVSREVSHEDPLEPMTETVPPKAAANAVDSPDTIPGAPREPITTLPAALAHFPTHVRRATKTRMQFLERRLLRQKQDLPPQIEIDALERRAEGLRAHLYMWPKGSPTWYVPREIIESHALPAVLTLKQGEKPGDLLTRSFLEVDKLKRRQQELLVRVGESQKAVDDFIRLILQGGNDIRALREEQGIEASVSTATRAALEAKVARNLPVSATRLLSALQMEWTEGSQKSREMEEERTRRLPFRTFEASSGEFLRVAKSASDGDAMLRLMPAHHTWVHVMSGEGSHVWVEKPKKAKPSTNAVREAAILAIHHSKQARAMEAEVYVATRADVDKRRDLAPGKVIVRKAGSLLVRYDDTELQKVLSTMQSVSS